MEERLIYTNERATGYMMYIFWTQMAYFTFILNGHLYVHFSSGTTAQDNPFFAAASSDDGKFVLWPLLGDVSSRTLFRTISYLIDCRC